MEIKSWKCVAGSIGNLSLKTDTLRETLKLKSGEILVKVKCIGMNFADIFAILGLYSATPKGEFIPGLEYSGVVEQVFDESSKYEVGDSIFGVTRFGAYTTHLVIGEKYTKTLPEGWSFQQGASFMVPALTAWYGLVELGGLKKNKTVLIHSAAGGVGLYCLDIVKHFNGVPISTVGMKNKKDFLIKRGLDEKSVIIRTNVTEFEGQLKTTLVDLKQTGVDIVMDSIGGDYFQTGYANMNKGGRLIIYGWGSFMPTDLKPNWLSLGWNYMWRPKLDPLGMIQDNKAVMGFNLIWLWDKFDELNEMVDEIMKIQFEKPTVGKEFDFENTLDAIKYFQSGQNIGKVVINVK